MIRYIWEPESYMKRKALVQPEHGEPQLVGIYDKKEDIFTVPVHYEDVYDEWESVAIPKDTIYEIGRRYSKHAIIKMVFKDEIKLPKTEKTIEPGTVLKVPIALYLYESEVLSDTEVPMSHVTLPLSDLYDAELHGIDVEYEV